MDEVKRLIITGGIMLVLFMLLSFFLGVYKGYGMCMIECNTKLINMTENNVIIPQGFNPSRIASSELDDLLKTINISIPI